MEEDRNKHNRRGTAVWIAVLAAAVVAAGALLLPRLTQPAATSAQPTPVPTATPLPTPDPGPRGQGGYFVCPDGLFYPAEPLTRGEAAGALSRAVGKSVSPLGDETQILTEESFAALLKTLWPAPRVEETLELVTGRGDENITRAEAAVCVNRLLGAESVTDETLPGFPDVAPDSWGRGDILAAAVSGRIWDGPNGRPAPGFVLVDGALYCAGEDGYFLKNTYVGSLFFGPGGRYTSGSPELDGYVRQLIREHTDDAMTREERLRAVYDYIRDNYTYLVRHYYHIGDLGWEIEEALTMYSTGRGNCYCYAAAFWAAARGLGYDAKIVSGTVDDDAPHGWVEILQDGERRTYDVELEMLTRSEGQKNSDFFAMTDAKRMGQQYIEHAFSDDLVPRESNPGLLPG